MVRLETSIWMLYWVYTATHNTNLKVNSQKPYLNNVYLDQQKKNSTKYYSNLQDSVSCSTTRCFKYK